MTPFYVWHDAFMCVCVPWLRGILAPCNALQHTATHYTTLQHTANSCVYVCPDPEVSSHSATHCNALKHTATHCNALQRTATHCNALHHTATHCKFMCVCVPRLRGVSTLCSTLQHTQHTETHCNTLQHTWNLCVYVCPDSKVSKHTATHCITLKRIAPHCNTLQIHVCMCAPS